MLIPYYDENGKRCHKMIKNYSKRYDTKLLSHLTQEDRDKVHWYILDNPTTVVYKRTACGEWDESSSGRINRTLLILNELDLLDRIPRNVYVDYILGITNLVFDMIRSGHDYCKLYDLPFNIPFECAKLNAFEKKRALS